jgi:cytochrome c biogenesis protein CcdA
MAALFALGVMSVGWMLLISALIAIEKLVPWQASANRTVATTLAALGIAVALVPSHVPGLTLPTAAAVKKAMMTMNGDRRPTAASYGPTTNQSVKSSP